jgi:signal peptide peptidase SppA
MDRYAHVAQYVYSSVWAILPDKLQIILSLLEFRRSGGVLTDAEIAERIGAVSRPAIRASGAVAVIPIFGTIAHHAGMMVESSGGVSTESIASRFRAALADPQVGAVLLHIDSPGGSVSGVPELAAEIHAARGQKPIVAQADAMAASAAYWIGTAADELVVTPSGMVGSIGVISSHTDYSEALAKEGVRTTLITAGKYKGEGNPYAPLSDEDRTAMQERIDDYYGMFVKAVARHRGVSVEAVRSGYGEGRVVTARRAVDLGMADRVATLDETISRLTGPRRQGNAARAERARMLLY